MGGVEHWGAAFHSLPAEGKLCILHSGISFLFVPCEVGGERRGGAEFAIRMITSFTLLYFFQKEALVNHQSLFLNYF